MDWIQSLLFNDASVAHTVILLRLCHCGGSSIGQTEVLRSIFGSYVCSLRRADSRALRLLGREKHTPLRTGVRFNSLYLLHRSASGTQLLLLVQARRAHPQYAGRGYCSSQHCCGARHLLPQRRPGEHAHDGGYSLGCRYQHPGTGCRTTNPVAAAVRRFYHRSPRDCPGLCRRLSAGCNRHHRLDAGDSGHLQGEARQGK